MMQNEEHNPRYQPESPEDALNYIAFNTAQTADQLRLMVLQNDRAIKILKSISWSVAILAIIAVCSVIFALYTWARLESLAESAEVERILRERGVQSLQKQ